MKKIYYSLFVCLLAIFSTSCKKDKKAQIPSYLSIDKIQVKDSAGNLISSGDLDAWVYINDQFKGAFELPVRIPVLEKGPRRVDIRTGVAENGIYDLKVIYPFYKTYSEVVDFELEQIHKISPVVTYAENAKINTAWAGADFEGGINLNRSFKSDTILYQEANNSGISTLGDYVGSYYLTDENYIFEAYTDPFSDIPRSNPDIWMEMDYKSDELVSVGVYRGDDFSDIEVIVHFRPQSSWKKVYVKLAAGILSKPNASQYRLFIHTQKMSGLPVSKTSIDNVKLLHY